MNHTICDACDTVHHCTKHGCVPLQPHPHNLHDDMATLRSWLRDPVSELDRRALARVMSYYLLGYNP